MSNQVQVVKKETVRKLLNSHAYDLFYEIISLNKDTLLKKDDLLTVSSKELRNILNSLKKKDCVKIRAKISMLLTVIESFCIRINDRSFTTLCYLLPKD